MLSGTLIDCITEFFELCRWYNDNVRATYKKGHYSLHYGYNIDLFSIYDTYTLEDMKSITCNHDIIGHLDERITVDILLLERFQKLYTYIRHINISTDNHNSHNILLPAVLYRNNDNIITMTCGVDPTVFLHDTMQQSIYGDNIGLLPSIYQQYNDIQSLLDLLLLCINIIYKRIRSHYYDINIIQDIYYIQFIHALNTMYLLSSLPYMPSLSSTILPSLNNDDDDDDEYYNHPYRDMSSSLLSSHIDYIPLSSPHTMIRYYKQYILPIFDAYTTYAKTDDNRSPLHIELYNNNLGLYHLPYKTSSITSSSILYLLTYFAQQLHMCFKICQLHDTNIHDNNNNDNNNNNKIDIDHSNIKHTLMLFPLYTPEHMSLYTDPILNNINQFNPDIHNTDNNNEDNNNDDNSNNNSISVSDIIWFHRTICLKVEELLRFNQQSSALLSSIGSVQISTIYPNLDIYNDRYKQDHYNNDYINNTANKGNNKRKQHSDDDDNDTDDADDDDDNDDDTPNGDEPTTTTTTTTNDANNTILHNNATSFLTLNTTLDALQFKGRVALFASSGFYSDPKNYQDSTTCHNIKNDDEFFDVANDTDKDDNDQYADEDNDQYADEDNDEYDDEDNDEYDDEDNYTLTETWQRCLEAFLPRSIPSEGPMFFSSTMSQEKTPTCPHTRIEYPVFALKYQPSCDKRAIAGYNDNDDDHDRVFEWGDCHGLDHNVLDTVTRHNHKHITPNTPKKKTRRTISKTQLNLAKSRLNKALQTYQDINDHFNESSELVSHVISVIQLDFTDDTDHDSTIYPKNLRRVVSYILQLFLRISIINREWEPTFTRNYGKIASLSYLTLPYRSFYHSMFSEPPSLPLIPSCSLYNDDASLGPYLQSPSPRLPPSYRHKQHIKRWMVSINNTPLLAATLVHDSLSSSKCQDIYYNLYTSLFALSLSRTRHKQLSMTYKAFENLKNVSIIGTHTCLTQVLKRDLQELRRYTKRFFVLRAQSEALNSKQPFSISNAIQMTVFKGMDPFDDIGDVVDDDSDYSYDYDEDEDEDGNEDMKENDRDQNTNNKVSLSNRFISMSNALCDPPDDFIGDINVGLPQLGIKTLPYNTTPVPHLLTHLQCYALSPDQVLYSTIQSIIGYYTRHDLTLPQVFSPPQDYKIAPPPSPPFPKEDLVTSNTPNQTAHSDPHNDPQVQIDLFPRNRSHSVNQSPLGRLYPLPSPLSHHNVSSCSLSHSLFLTDPFLSSLAPHQTCFIVDRLTSLVHYISLLQPQHYTCSVQSTFDIYQSTLPEYQDSLLGLSSSPLSSTSSLAAPSVTMHRIVNHLEPAINSLDSSIRISSLYRLIFPHEEYSLSSIPSSIPVSDMVRSSNPFDLSYLRQESTDTSNDRAATTTKNSNNDETQSPTPDPDSDDDDDDDDDNNDNVLDIPPGGAIIQIGGYQFNLTFEMIQLCLFLFALFSFFTFIYISSPVPFHRF